MRITVSITSLLLLMCFFCVCRGSFKTDGLSLDSMVMYQEAGDGCGCYFYYRTIDEGNFILFWPPGPSTMASAIMKISNNIVQLDYEYETAKTFRFSNNTFTLSGQTSEYQVCAHDIKECEQLGEKGGATLKSINHDVTFPIIGTCGC